MRIHNANCEPEESFISLSAETRKQSSENPARRNYYGDAPDSFWNSNRPAGLHLGANARFLAKGRRMGLRLSVGLRPFLSHLRARPDWTMHGELDAARRAQPAH